MLSSRKLLVGSMAVVTTLVVMALASIPVASAQTCVITVKTVTGQTLTFTVNVPPGTPISSISLPVKVPIASVSESCAAPTSSSSGGGGGGGSGSTSSGQGSSSPSSSSSSGSGSGSGSTSKHKSGGGGGSSSHHYTPPPGGSSTGSKGKGKGSGGSSSGSTTTPKKSTKPPAPRTKNGVPTPSNPTFSFSLPGPAPLGVPNFFIDNFRIPPFLLPIYQAAGIEYDVPWQVLAGINEIETDYGRDLSVSSAGAVGWMQFLPSTWKTWGVDANGDGVADPYNPVDAIFSAARYLHAAGASKNLAGAIYAYNHAWWYVQSVLLRAKLIGGMPNSLIGALTSLVEGHFPVAAKAKYADDYIDSLAHKRVKGANAAIAVQSDPNTKGVAIFASQNSPVIAVNDGKIVKVGHNDPKWGNYIELQDANGNVYTYANLGSIPKLYPVPKPVKLSAAQIAKELSVPSNPRAPSSPATAGSQGSGSTVSTATATAEAKSVPPSLPTTTSTASGSVSAPMVKERLFADPSRPASYAAGGDLQIRSSTAQVTSFQNYFSDVLHLGKNQYTLQPLKAGAVVVAGTILGRLGPGTQSLASHVEFMIRPAGNKAPYIDPKPILDGWKLLEATAIYRAAGLDPFAHKDPTIGQILLMSKEQLQVRVLNDPHVKIYACGRRDIATGLIDRRVLAVIEFLSSSSLYPTVSGLECGHTTTGANGIDAAGATGSSVDFSAINNIPILGHQGPGSITDITIRRLLTLQGVFQPDEIISTMSYKGQSNTLSLPDHKNRLQVTYTPLFGSNQKLSQQIKTILQPGQWIDLINRINQIPEPLVPITPSSYAIKR